MISNETRERFLNIYEPLHPRLVRFVQHSVWNEEDAKDIVSEAVLISLEKFSSLKNEEAMLSYMFTIARRLIIKWRDKRIKMPMVELTPFNEVNVSDNEPDIKFRVDELKKAIALLKDKYREPLLMFEISGFSISEIAKILNLSESGVKSRLSRARMMLSEKLEGTLHEK